MPVRASVFDAYGTLRDVRSVRAAVERRLGVPPAKAMFVSGNGFDVGGAKRLGFRVG